MTDTAQEAADPARVLSELRKKSNGIVALRKRRDAGRFRSPNEAIALQKAERERAKLTATLPPLTLIK